ncbi:MAG: family 10 glycosylhydrolase [Armatimonadetes bacterium]|nr:family 10 glycosylhydrolase [Armatimonadota bacterium]
MIPLLALLLSTPQGRFQPLPSIGDYPPVVLDRQLHEDNPTLPSYMQGRVIWVDGTANLAACSSEENIRHLVANVRDAGFNTVVYDVKPIVGYTLYPSRLTAQLTDWQGQTMPKGFDPLKEMINQCHFAGLRLLVSLNAFSEGHGKFGKGPGYQRPDWQTTILRGTPYAKIGGLTFPLTEKPNAAPPAGFAATFTTKEALADIPPADVVFVSASGVTAKRWMRNGYAVVGKGLPHTHGLKVLLRLEPKRETAATNQEQFPLMVNPHSLDVRDRELEFVREIASQYPIDGLLYDDRFRFANLCADFSDETLASFAHSLRKPRVQMEQVLTRTLNPNGVRGIKPGPLFDAWIAFRSQALKAYVQRASVLMRALRPNASFGLYVGSNYPDYQAFGANYGDPQTNAGFWFLTPEYRAESVARQLDLLISGCYYTTATVNQALQDGKPLGQNVEAAASLANSVIAHNCWHYAGIMLSSFQDDPDGLASALQAAMGSSQGVMVFDYSHRFEDFLPVFKALFKNGAVAPDGMKSYTSWLRQQPKPKRVILTGGSVGAGH